MFLSPIFLSKSPRLPGVKQPSDPGGSLMLGRAKVGLLGFRSAGDFVYGGPLDQPDRRSRDLSYAGEVGDRKMGDRKMKTKLPFMEKSFFPIFLSLIFLSQVFFFVDS